MNTVPSTAIKNVVLVHGGIRRWLGLVAGILGPRESDYNVTIVQNPTTSLADDVAADEARDFQQSGPVVLVGHSYGGVVISEPAPIRK